MGFFQKSGSQNGQILLIVVLAAVVSLTVGLSVASRVITNTRIATDETDSQKALSAAEAGVDQLIKDNSQTNVSVSFDNNSAFNATNTPLQGEQIVLNGGKTILQDDGTDVWLSSYPNYTSPWTGNLKIYWSDNNSSDCTKNAALEVVVISGAVATPQMRRYAFDSCSSRKLINSFNNTLTNISPAKVVGGKSYNHSAFVPVYGAGFSPGLIARVVPLYANTSVMIEGYASGSTSIPQILPAQGYVIESTGTSGNATRKVRVFQGFPKLPTEYFPYSLFLP